jgi:oligoendopeptidase F
MSTTTDAGADAGRDPRDDADLPRWSIDDVFDSLHGSQFRAAMERAGAEVSRLVATCDEHGIRSIAPRPVTEHDGRAADAVIQAYNRAAGELDVVGAAVYATVTTDSRDEHASALLSQLEMDDATMRPLLARLADWVHALGVDALAEVSEQVREHLEPLRRLADRSAHQMSETEEGLYAELQTTGSSAWYRLHQEVTSQLTATITYPDGREERLPMPTVRGLATSPDPAVRAAAFTAELEAWPTIATPIAAALNAIKGEANVVNRRRNWSSPIDASLYANSVSRATFDAMHEAVVSSLPDFRRWMRTKARLHGYEGGLRWSDLVAPIPQVSSEVSWDDGIAWVRSAFATYGSELSGLVDRALAERWIDAAPRDGKAGGAFCMQFVDDRSLVLLNWAGSVESAQTAAHELGHAFHNSTLAGRTPLQKRLPMALAETASIFCETLAVEAGLARLEGMERLALLDVDLVGSTQVVVDIHSRFLFESELFARRQRRTIGVSELNEMMLQAQLDAYGDGLDPDTRHPYMWLLKPHYYGSHFYNWPYTYGLLFGLGLFAQYRSDPDRFRATYADALSRAGIDSAEALGAMFGLDVTDPSFWVASLDVVRDRMAQYDALAASVTG